LYMWDETNWYKYDTAIKRYRYDTARNTWERDILYYVDEERLFGSERTTPTAIYKDPFERLWIGSLGNGFSMYNAKTERFTNYFPANSPLLSSHITHFGYEATEGLLLIGTPDGLNTLKIGRWVKPETSLEILKAYPNPFRPQLLQSVAIVNQPTDIMPRGKNICRIYDSSGALVADLEESYFSRFEWDGKNKADKDCASGVYFFVVTDEAGNSKKGKIVLIR
ncbi:MAG: T9SS type A sorting domain-containing protein, partial [Candidatus Cloacimonetes bacterium]|nr:T9SS type A sorting domain-containing protein [Candidatus Cloacimonadota bacterium]